MRHLMEWKNAVMFLYHNYVDLASTYRILPQIRLDPDPDTLDPAPPNSPDIQPDLDPVHPYGR